MALLLGESLRPLMRSLEFKQPHSFAAGNAYALPLWRQLMWTFLFLAMATVATCGNLIVIWIVLFHKRMRTVTNYFIGQQNEGSRKKKYIYIYGFMKSCSPRASTVRFIDLSSSQVTPGLTKKALKVRPFSDGRLVKFSTFLVDVKRLGSR